MTRRHSGQFQVAQADDFLRLHGTHAECQHEGGGDTGLQGQFFMHRILLWWLVCAPGKGIAAKHCFYYGR
jgi:hypothetical protein